MTLVSQQSAVRMYIYYYPSVSLSYPRAPPSTHTRFSSFPTASHVSTDLFTVCGGHGTFLALDPDHDLSKMSSAVGELARECVPFAETLPPRSTLDTNTFMCEVTSVYSALLKAVIPHPHPHLQSR